MSEADKETPELLQFPCDFPIKIMGLNDPALVPAVLAVVRAQFPDFAEDAMQMRNSSGGRYLGVTVTVRAESRAQL
ncbi:MAG: DUF493 domain-containing protein, partial [Rhodocyclaceae bacterium]|nr:DUF493 domain-containing protein [Rhodocyclaceae bacterium]